MIHDIYLFSSYVLLNLSVFIYLTRILTGVWQYVKRLTENISFTYQSIEK